ncbi:MAG: hypothetical protein ACRD96_29265, partial [Bryobacteraceae bacterium]
MPESLDKLSPHRDLQCYFERPSSIAALSDASATGFTVSGTWRQQFDWAVIEWNRDNVFEHPLFRNLPDGNLSGLTLTYDETRTNCIPLDSTLFPTVDWPHLRVWAVSGGVETFHKVLLKNYATAIEGSYTPASATFTLEGTPTSGDYVELAWSSEHHTYQLTGSDTLETAAQAIVDSVNAFSSVMEATRSGAQITLHYVGAGQTMANSTTGHNGNRIGIYGNVSGAQTESWSPAWQKMSGGTSPTKWRVSLNFASLTDINSVAVPTTAVRKMRWTYAADQQTGHFVRSEFQAQVTNWTVTGTNRAYAVAGPGSRRIEDDRAELAFTGTWTESRGNFSGGSLRFATATGASVSWTYTAALSHKLYVGTRKAPGGATVTVAVDGQTVLIED